jgi:hypothetical protein
MPKSKATSKAGSNVSPFAITRPLTLEEKVALASASLAIQRLPRCLQQSSNAFDMQAMLVDPSSVGRGAYILAQAKSIHNSFSGFRPGAIDGSADIHPTHREDFEKFIADAIKAHEAEIAEEAAYLATPEGKAATAKWAKFDAEHSGQQAAE